MRLFLISLVVLTTTSTVHAQEPTPDADRTKAIADHWLKVSRDYAEAFTIKPIEENGRPYDLHGKAVFHHTQSVRGDDIGAMHLWLQPDKRPAVIGVVFAWTSSPTTRMVSYEFHSLTEQPLTLTHKDRAIWTSQTPGFEWKEFPKGTMPPAPRKLQQKLQMKRIARQFSASTTDSQMERWQLRSVPTPIYEYDSEAAGVIHGAMYVFCQGTDTEVILLVEAYNASKSAARPDYQWRYAIVPFTDYKAVVAFDGEEIWVSPPGQVNENGKPHYWSFIGPEKKPEIELD